MKDAEGMPKFLYSAVDDFEVQDIQASFVEPKRPSEEFLHDRGLQIIFRTVQQEANLVEERLIGGKGTGTGLGGVHLVIHVLFLFFLGRKILSADRLLVKEWRICEVCLDDSRSMKIGRGSVEAFVNNAD